MFPYRDANPSSRPPIVTVALILINAIVFIQELALGQSLEAFIFQFGVVPKKWLFLGQEPELTLGATLLPYLTSIFLHGGWLHVIGNMWYLWIFGDNIEDQLGHFRFIVFYLMCGIAAGAVHTFFNLHSALPAVGASGAIAGVLGAYLIRFPHARIQTFIPYFYQYQTVELPALVVLGMWFIIQFLNGSAAIAATAESGGGVAWWAHIGGFAAGILFFTILKPNKKIFR